MNDDGYFYGIIGLIFLIFIGFIVASFVTHENKVLIDDTWWNYYTLVQYDTTSCSPVFDDDGFSHMSCDTDTTTRCSTMNSGRDLPAIAPEIGCEPRRSDYITHELYWNIMYHIQDTDKQFTKRVDESKWRFVQDGREFVIETNALGGIVSIRR